MKLIKRLLREEEGYGTVEMILIIAGVGLLATGIFNILQKSLSTGSDSAVNQVSDSINDIIQEWNNSGD